MKNFIFSLLLLFSLNIIGQNKKDRLIASCESRGCNGSEYCTACKNCSGCKHCAKEGGTCSVCNAPVKKKVLTSKKTKKKKF